MINKNKNIKKEFKDYIVTGGHGFIIYNKNDNKLIKIPNNIRIILYSKFCNKSCTNTEKIINYICNVNRENFVQGPNSIIESNSIIPELYVIGDKLNNTIDNITLTDYNKKIIFNYEYNSNIYRNKAITLSEILILLKYRLKNKLNNKNIIINLHWTLCLDVFNNSNNIINNINNVSYYNLINIRDKVIINENILGINKKLIKKKSNIIIHDDSIEITYYISEINNIIYNKTVKIIIYYNKVVNDNKLLNIIINTLNKYKENFKLLILDILIDNINIYYYKKIVNSITKYNQLINNNYTNNNNLNNTNYHVKLDNLLIYKIIDNNFTEIYINLRDIYIIKNLINIYLFMIQYAIISNNFI